MLLPCLLGLQAFGLLCLRIAMLERRRWVTTGLTHLLLAGGNFAQGPVPGLGGVPLGNYSCLFPFQLLDMAYLRGAMDEDSKFEFDLPCCPALPRYQELATRKAQVEAPDKLFELLANFKANYNSLEGSRVTSLPSSPMNVWMKVVPTRLYSVDQVEQTFTLTFELWWMWRDCRLVWQPNLEHPLDSSLLVLNEHHEFFNKFWWPGVAFQESDRDSTRHYLDRHLYIFADGAIILHERRNQVFNCKFDFQDLPYDTQRCSVTTSLPAYSNIQVKPLWNQDPLFMEDISNNMWSVSTMETVQKTLKEDFLDVAMPKPAKAQISALKFTLELKRKRMDFIFTYFVPTFFYWLCSYIGFWIDPNAVPARVALGLIPILTLNNKVSALRSSLPPINKTFKAGKFMEGFFFLTISQLLFYGIINWSARHLKIHKKPDGVDDAVATQAADVAPAAAGEEGEASKKALAKHHAELCQWRLACAVNAHLDRHCRWIFPLLAFLLIVLSIRPWEI